MVYYYLIYLTDGTIHLKPFKSKSRARKFKEGCDKYYQDKGRYKHSKITKRDLSEVGELWL